jgi:hypothetical protein
MTEKIIEEALRGPWVAVLADRWGFVYESVADARENTEDPDEEHKVTIVRGSALPNDRSGCRPRLPGSNLCGDRVFELDDVYLDGDGDDSTGAEARYAQAVAMAAGLNAASGSGAGRG